MRIHITGASGSGVSTLGAALADTLRGTHLESDRYYWLPTVPPFTQKRATAQRLSLVLADVRAASRPVLAGSIVEWGAPLEDAFDLIVFLYVETAVRVARLREREMRRHGHVDAAFLDWAAQYDVGPPEGRSLAKHRAWLAARSCPVIELHGDRAVEAQVTEVLRGAPTIREVSPPSQA